MRKRWYGSSFNFKTWENKNEFILKNVIRFKDKNPGVKKINYLFNLAPIIWITFEDISVPVSKLSFIDFLLI